MLTIASTLLSCLLALVPSPPRLQIEVVFDGLPMRSGIEASAMAEVGGIWAPYGVDVHATNPNDERRYGAVRLVVTLANHPPEHQANGTLGSIVFDDGVPRPAIVMYLEAIDTLVSSTTVMGFDDRQLATGFHDFIVGRVFGRALAHEIGHYLLRSRNHSRDGLMRARQLAPDLVGHDRQRFALSADQVTQLQCLLAKITHANNLS
jgi:hypothetical protein